MSDRRPEQQVVDALMDQVQSLTPSEMNGFQLAAMEIGGVLDRYGGVGILALGVIGARLSLEAAEMEEEAEKGGGP